MLVATAELSSDFGLRISILDLIPLYPILIHSIEFSSLQPFERKIFEPCKAVSKVVACSKFPLSDVTFLFVARLRILPDTVKENDWTRPLLRDTSCLSFRFCLTSVLTSR